MNNLKFRYLLALLMLLPIGYVSCSEDDEVLNDVQTKQEVETKVKAGTWRITKFIDSGDDEKHHFTGYNFTFASNGVLTAANVVGTYTGTWSITDSNSNDDSPNDLDFNIFFNLANKFEELNDEWDILTYNSNKIELIDISGGNGGTDYLTFEKN